jgi:hypothetical protein
MTTATVFMTLTKIGVIATAALGCATASRGIGQGADATMQGPSALVALDPSVVLGRKSDLLTAAELSAALGLADMTAYDAVLRLRPGFLNPRDPVTGAIGARDVLPAVFVNGMYSGGPEVLRVISVSAVAEMQYVRSLDALYRYGPQYGAGVILVRLRR